jgi:hypothetical protein
MPDDLVTAAVFGDLTQAQAARLHLEAAGVPAFLADENMAAGVFSFAAAVGGIKLQVPKSRLEEALRSLDERMPAGQGPDWTEVDVGPPEPDSPDAAAQVPVLADATAPVSETEEEPTLREQRADGLFRAIVIAMLLAPLILLAFWRLVQVWVSDERLRPRYRNRALFAAAFIVPYTLVVLLVWRFVCCGVVR